MGKIFLHDQKQENTVENTRGGRLTVICSHGLIVKAVCGSLEYSVVADDTNKAIFDSLRHGTWEISIDNPNMIVSKTVEIVTDYDVVIDFFSGTIVVEYPENSVCTCTNGIVTYTAPDMTGIWYCSIYDTGTWTVSCTDGTQTKTRDIVVNNTDSYVNVFLSYFTATINVTYPAGAMCTCSNGNTLYSASNSTGSWSFTVYKAGDWTISASDGIQTVQNTVNVNYDGQVESTTIKFFKSTITITYPEGATCTCTDGVTSFTAPNTSGKWTVTVPRTGVWTIRAFKGNGDVTQTVNITYEGQTASVLCEFFVAYINVTYPKNTFKTVLWRINEYGVKEDIAVDNTGTGTHNFSVDQVGSYEVGIYRVSPYVGIENESKDYASGSVTISTDKQTVNVTLKYVTLPEFTYSGSYDLVDDNNKSLTSTDGDWNIRFLTGGILKFTKLNGASNGIDVFVVGGGGNGGDIHTYVAGDGVEYTAAGGGGGGGYRTTQLNVKVNTTEPYQITVGGSGGASVAFGVTANAGGNGGNGSRIEHLAGGDGGTGGSKGGLGGYNHGNGEKGEDGAYPFYETAGYRYGAGGGGGYGWNGGIDQSGPTYSGGADGGGASGKNGADNSGGGGGGNSRNGSNYTGSGKGGSGIVIIRNKRY